MSGHEHAISTTGASSEVSINILVTVQEGGQWMDAQFMGTANELLRQLFDPEHWLTIEHKKEGNKTKLTVVDGLSIGKGMSTLVTIHSLKIKLEGRDEEAVLQYDSHFRGLTNFDNIDPYDE